MSDATMGKCPKCKYLRNAISTLRSDVDEKRYSASRTLTLNAKREIVLTPENRAAWEVEAMAYASVLDLIDSLMYCYGLPADRDDTSTEVQT